MIRPIAQTDDPLPWCPLCEAAMTPSRATPDEMVWHCVECESSLTIPTSAWDRVLYRMEQRKRVQAKGKPKP